MAQNAATILWHFHQENNGTCSKLVALFWHGHPLQEIMKRWSPDFWHGQKMVKKLVAHTKQCFLVLFCAVAQEAKGEGEGSRVGIPNQVHRDPRVHEFGRIHPCTRRQPQRLFWKCALPSTSGQILRWNEIEKKRDHSYCMSWSRWHSHVVLAYQGTCFHHFFVGRAKAFFHHFYRFHWFKACRRTKES